MSFPLLKDHLAARLQSNRPTNAWYKFESQHVYIRIQWLRLEWGQNTDVTYPPLERCVTLANISTPETEQRKGGFYRLLDLIREHTDMPIVIENVRDDWFFRLRYNGWHLTRSTADISRTLHLRKGETRHDLRTKTGPTVSEDADG